MLLATVAPARADAPSLHLTVRGPIDHAQLRARVADELGIAVDEVDGACDAPCLDVSIDDGTATLLYAPRNGPTRLRAVNLGSDAAQWSEMVTLLAGNLLRDEASDLLAELPNPDVQMPAAAGDNIVVPEPPAIEAPPALAMRARAPQPVITHNLIGFGLVPVLSSDGLGVGTVRHLLSVDALIGISAGSSIFTASGVVDIEQGPVSGAQVGGVAAIADSVSGFQVAGVAAVAGELNGVQIAGTAAVADHVFGLQIAGIASVQDGGGSQVAGIASISDGNAETQLGGIAAIADGAANLQVGGIASVADRANVQVAGIASVADGSANLQVGGIAAVAGTANFQIAGLVTVADRVRGLQIAPINVAGRVDGVQIGVINVGSEHGFSLGLINIVPGGRYDLEGTVDSSRMGTVLFRHGGRNWHNVYGVGGHNVDSSGPSDDVWMYGFGFGPSFRSGSTVVDLEAIGWQVNHGARHETDLSLLGQLRLSISQDLGAVAVVVGGALNTYISTDQQSPLIIERRVPGSPMETGVTVDVWPSAFVGVRL